VHAFLLSLALLTKGKNAHASRYLAALVLSLGVLLLSSSASVAGYMRAHPHLIALDAPLPLLFGPLLYLYVRAITGVRTDDERTWLHAMPFAVYIAFLALGFWWRSPSYKLAFLDALMAGDEPLYVTISDLGKFVLGIGYTGAALTHLRRHRIRIEEYFANLQAVALLWLRVLTWAMLAVWCLALVFFVARFLGLQVRAEASAATLGIGTAIVVFAIGYFSMWQPEIFAWTTAAQDNQPTPDRGTAAAASRLAALEDEAPNFDEPSKSSAPETQQTQTKASERAAAEASESPEVQNANQGLGDDARDVGVSNADTSVDEPATEADGEVTSDAEVEQAEAEAEPLALEAHSDAGVNPPPTSTDSRYKRTRLASKEAEEVAAVMLQLMEEDGLYRRPDVTLATLAERCGTSNHDASQVLNTVFEKNFYAFVNGFRVDHVKAALADESRSDMPLLDLAMEAGFGSKSTFNSFFKKATGQTPSQFRVAAKTAN
jgi:AraC-like DNA-binding protein